MTALPATTWPDWLLSAPYFTGHLMDVVDPQDAPKLPDAARAVYYFNVFDGEVSNGGVMQYFYNQAHQLPGFHQAAAFIERGVTHAGLEALRPVLPLVQQVHAAWDGVASRVQQARDSGDWPEDLFENDGAAFEELQNTFYRIHHAATQQLCHAMVQEPQRFFTIEALDVPAKGVKHVELRGGTQRLRFENGFPIGPNVFEHRSGACAVVEFSRDRQQLTCQTRPEGGFKHWIHYPSQISSAWSFNGQRLEGFETRRSLWRREGVRLYFDGKTGQVVLSELGFDHEALHTTRFDPVSGTVLRRQSQEGRQQRQQVYWPSGALNIQALEDENGHRRILRCLSPDGQDLAPGGTGVYQESLPPELELRLPKKRATSENNQSRRLRWLQGHMQGGIVQGPVEEISIQPDGSDRRVARTMTYTKGRPTPR